MIKARSLLEAIIDFGEDESIDDNLQEVVQSRVTLLKASIEEHLNSSLKGELLRSGIKVAIFGPPNAGKSSLLNIITGRDASIVSPEPGTTRDIVESIIDIGGFPVIISDTAGLRDGLEVGLVEREGVRRAKTRISSSDFCICMLPIDATVDSTTKEQIEVLLNAGEPDSRVILLLNKIDTHAGELPAESIARHSRETGVPAMHIYPISCTTGFGIEAFLTKIVCQFAKLTSSEQGEDVPAVLGTNPRQRDLIGECLNHLQCALGQSTIRATQLIIIRGGEERRCHRC